MKPETHSQAHPPAASPALESAAVEHSQDETDRGDLSESDRELAMLAACACATGERLQSAANTGVLAVLATGVYALVAVPDGARGTSVVGAALLAIVALVIWAWQTVLAARLGLDAQVFRAFTLGPADRLGPAGFDRALARAGLRQAGAPRGMDARWSGARRLLIHQGLCVAALALMATATLAWIGMHP